MKPRQKQKLRKLEQQLTETQNAIQIPEDPVEFCTKILGFQPTVYQQELIRQFQQNQFIAARWCRQSGKSQTVSALLLHYALLKPHSYIGIVGPSWRQTKLIIKRINTFLRKLPRGSYRKPQHTIVS